MDPRTHKILSMASQAHTMVNDKEGARYQILLVNWDNHTILVADNMEEYHLHVNDICLDSDRFMRETPLDPNDF